MVLPNNPNYRLGHWAEKANVILIGKPTNIGHSDSYRGQFYRGSLYRFSQILQLTMFVLIIQVYPDGYRDGSARAMYN